jgi:hypothetical protein
MSMSQLSESQRRLWLAALAIAVFVYAIWFRTHGIAESFALRGDQIRDWTVALRPFAHLPLSGVPSTAGGTTIGPAYYWFLWVVARTIGPFVDYLPHAGGIGIATAHSLSDFALFFALARRLHSLLLVTALVLLVVTAPYDATLSATIWNPPLAETFVKLAIALLLWHRDITTWRSAAATATGWLALHCHTGAVVVVAPILTLLIARPFVERKWRVALLRMGSTVLIIGTLQGPWLLHRMQTPVKDDNRIESSLSAALMSPRSSLHLRASAEFVTKSVEFLMIAPATVPFFGMMLVAGVAATTALNRDVTVLAASVGPLVTAIGAFALWQGPLNEVYWCLTLTAPAAIAATAWIDKAPPLWRQTIAAAALGVVLYGQPARATVGWSFQRVPGYGSMVAGCRTILRDSVRIREIAVSFPVPPDTDPTWLFSIMGGALYDGSDARRAVIDWGGSVRYE